MNERIRELAEQAWDSLIDEMGDVYREDGINWDFLHAYDKRYAELIVRECINCSNDLVKHYIDNHNESDQALLLASISDYVNEIKKHFGVES